MYEPISEEVESVAKPIIDALLQVHQHLGPGLLESVYETCLCHELEKRKLAFERQKSLPIIYDGLRLDGSLQLDLLVNDSVIVELKAVERLLPVHEAQLLSYLKLSNIRLGLLINFNVPLFKDGIKRRVL